MADITSMRWMGSTSTPAFSFLILVCLVTTTPITGPTNLRMSPPTRPGFSKACVCRFSQPPLEDRAMAHQWMAILWVGQFEEGSGWTDQVDTEALGQHHLQQLRPGPRRSLYTESRPRPYRQQH